MLRNFSIFSFYPLNFVFWTVGKHLIVKVKEKNETVTKILDEEYYEWKGLEEHEVNSHTAAGMPVPLLGRKKGWWVPIRKLEMSHDFEASFKVVQMWLFLRINYCEKRFSNWQD